MLIESHDTIDSTNAEALRLVTRGQVSGWTLVTAKVQEAGRGRRERAWVSRAGNAYTSFIVPKDRRAEWRRPWLLGFVAALAVHDVVETVGVEPGRVRLKWPNDVLIDGRKVSGILLESAGTAAFVVAGIGINVAHHPAETAYPATHLDAELPSPVTVAAVVGTLGALLPARVEQWLELGFEDIRRAWLDRAHEPGAPLTVRTEAGEVPGRFVTIDADGQLVLDTDAGTRRTFAAGDVFPGLRP